MEKKNVAIIILAIALVASGVGNIILALPYFQFVPTPQVTLLIGDLSGPYTMEPLDTWDSASNDMLRYIIEGLYEYDLSDPEMPLVPVLAADEGTWEDSTTFTVNLKQNVQFHDGNIMDADDVKFTFDRMLYFLNDSGTLPSDEPVMEPAMLYQLPDGETPIIQSVEVIDSDTVTFHLNEPYAIFKKILGYPSAHILSEASTPATTRHTFDTPAVGTGPFNYIHYLADTELRYIRNNNYHGDNAYWETVVHVIIENPTTRCNAMLTHDIDVLFGPIPSLYDIFDDDESIIYYQRDESWGGSGLSYAYLGMNNHLINSTWRSAISFAYDYDYLIDEIQQGTVDHAMSPLAPAFLPGFNQSELDAPYHNLTRARMYMQSMGFGTTFALDDDTDWLAVAESTTPFRQFNYSYNIGNPIREPQYPMLIDNLGKIGCAVEDGGTTWPAFLDMLYGRGALGFDALDLYFVGWGPDYLDPFNMLAPLFSNISSSNSAQVNDPDLEDWFIEVLAETDDAQRTLIYEDILTQLVEVIRPHCFGYHPKGNYVHSADLQDRSYNAMGNWWAYPLWRNTTTTAALELPRGAVGHTPPPWAGTVGP